MTGGARMETLVTVDHLKKYFPVFGGVFKRRVADVRAVDDVNLEIFKGECFGIVGESGCGKTTLGKTIIRLYPATAGQIYLDVLPATLKEIRDLEQKIADPKSGIKRQELSRMKNRLKVLRSKTDLAKFSGHRLHQLRRKMQIVYQDPTTSLDPRMLIKDIVSEPLIAQGVAKGRLAMNRTLEILEEVGLSERHMFRYPHEFSGGQRQRVAVARALVTHPEFVVLDEPTSAVDVSVRAQLLEMFMKLQKDFGLTYLFVSHDLSVVEVISNRVGVMYLGKIVELADTNEIFRNALHPYTQALMASIPLPDPTQRRERAPLKGDVPSPINPPSGCRFHPRCPVAKGALCPQKEPQLIDVGKGHYVACFAVTENA
jgi:oligopeptide/dipeptide ABC transporter ATP-binding protein